MSIAILEAGTNWPSLSYIKLLNAILPNSLKKASMMAS